MRDMCVFFTSSTDRTSTIQGYAVANPVIWDLLNRRISEEDLQGGSNENIKRQINKKQDKNDKKGKENQRGKV